MILKNILIKNGLIEKKIYFTPKTNLIFSKKNSVGKTTFIREILYALGYNIPSTKGLSFKKMEFEITLESKGTEFKLIRRNDCMRIYYGNDDIQYTLPYDLHDIQALLIAFNNQDVLDNILGAFYVDQEKGWTLLNRGKVIGNIHFSIDQLILGIADRDATFLINKIKKIEIELAKYKYMYSVSEYQEEINGFVGNISYDTYDETIEKELMLLKLQRYELLNNLNQIKSIIKKNKQLLQFIDEMKLIIKLDNGREVLVTRDNLVCYEDNESMLSAKRKILEGDIVDCEKKIFNLESKQNDKQKLFDVQTLIDEFDASIKRIKINPISVAKIISGLKTEKKKANIELENLARNNNEAVSKLSSYVKKYAVEFGLDEKYYDDIFTKDLKSLTGAIFHKLIFAFRLGYIKIITETIGAALPIILDSPSGREVEYDTIKMTLNVLQRDFSEHQIIIASIINFDLKDKTIIEFKEKIFD